MFDLGFIVAGSTIILLCRNKPHLRKHGWAILIIGIILFLVGFVRGFIPAFKESFQKTYEAQDS